MVSGIDLMSLEQAEQDIQKPETKELAPHPSRAAARKPQTPSSRPNNRKQDRIPKNEEEKGTRHAHEPECTTKAFVNDCGMNHSQLVA